jgi:uncharacterized repeat protein (TIGR01451 family)
MLTRIALTGALLVAGIAALSVSFAGEDSQGPVPARIVAIPQPDIDLSVDVVQEGRVLTYTIGFDNVGEGVARTVYLRDFLPEGSIYLGDEGDLDDRGFWTGEYEDLLPGPHNKTIVVELSNATAHGDRIVNLVEVEYIGYTGSWIKETYEHEFRLSLPTPEPPIPLWVVAAPVAAAAAALGFVAYRSKGRPKFEQVFLLDIGGRLIRYWRVEGEPSNDPDVMGGMFVVLSEFVRDSFRENRGGLQELQIGDSHVFFVEGRHAVLATVVNGTRMKGLPGQMKAAVSDFEARNGPSLANWSGRLDELMDADAVVEGLVSGQYAHHRGP